MNDNKTFFRKAEQKKLGWKDIFSDVFRRHTREENARLFLAGTALTTPDGASMLAKWVKPYMFARIFLVGFVLAAVSLLFGNEKFLPFVFTLGSYLVPMTVMFFIWEMNIPRNISFAAVLAVFLVGGVESLIFTMLLSYFSFGSNLAAQAFSVGLIEETAKVLAVIIWTYKGDKKYILSGMLVGAAVGAGFAAVESAGYAIVGTNEGWDMGILLLRAFMAPGGHVAYAAVTGGALAWAQGGKRLSAAHLANPKFLGGYAFSVLVHAAYDYCCFKGSLLFLLVSVIPVIGAYQLLKTGLNQVVDAAMSHNADRLTVALDHDFLDKLAAKAGDGGGSYADRNVSGASSADGRKASVPAAPHQLTELRIQGIRGVFAGRRFAMQPRVRLGRDPRRSDLVFPADTAGVSGVHCEFLFREDCMYVKDLESTYGTYVNGSRLTPDQPAKLRIGDHICLGSNQEELQFTLKGGKMI